MDILKILNSPWAIDPKHMNEIVSIYSTQLRSDKIDFKGLTPGELSTQGKINVDIINGNAIIPIKGTITKGVSFFSFFFGGSSTKKIKTAIDEAINNPEVKRIILNIDSPGGTVDGSFELADYIYQAKDEKSIITYSDGTIASAAYLIAASTDSIYISGKTNNVGSIGVIATHIDETALNNAIGLKITEIVSGKYKNLESSNQELSEYAQEEIKKDVDYLFSIFATDVADRRNLSLNKIIDFQAKTFIGHQSIQNGLVDGVSTLDQLTNNQEIEVYNMKIESTSDLRAEYPELITKIETEATKKGEEKGVLAGRKQEIERQEGIRGLALPGHEALIESFLKNEKISVGEAAIKINQAEKSLRLEADKVIKNEAPAPVSVENHTVDNEEPKEAKKDFMVIVNEYIAKNKCSRKEALAAVSVSHLEEYDKFLKRGK